MKRAADAYAFALLDKYLFSKAAEDDRYQARIDFRVAPQFFFIFDSIAENARYVFDNKRLKPALLDEAKKSVVDYLDSALPQESKTNRAAAPGKEGGGLKYGASAMAVLNGDYPRAGAIGTNAADSRKGRTAI